MKNANTTPKLLGKNILDNYNILCRKIAIRTPLVIATLAPAAAMAQVTTWGASGQQVAAQGGGLSDGALASAGVVGFIFIIIGLVTGKSAKKNQEGYGGPAGSIVFGACLLAVPVIAGVTITSLLGSNAADPMIQQLTN